MWIAEVIPAALAGVRKGSTEVTKAIKMRHRYCEQATHRHR